MDDTANDKTRVSITDISDFLHDARLLTIDWKPELAQVSLVYDCLRRNTDGSEMEDRRVALRLSGVKRIAAYYNAALIAVHPSRLQIKDAFSASCLKDWPYPPTETYFSIGSRESLFEMRTSWRIDWIEGASAKQLADQGAVAIHLEFYDQQDYSEASCRRFLYFECDEISPMSSGASLDLAEWSEQCSAWWKSCEDRWEEIDEADEDDDAEPIEEDCYIPAGENFTPDLTYNPPAQPAFLIPRTDAPQALLKPVKDMVEGVLERNWERVATAWPNYDKSPVERAEELEQQYLGEEFGRWVYARQVDNWWEEGSQACITIRGIEHIAPDDEDPAMNLETVVTFMLRKSDEGWRILSYSQGFPAYETAEPFNGSKPWLDGWNMAEE